ncbi:MAG: NHL repeat-containing protein, partial [Desulfuromonadales bacterium]|nr:NHL repeat-containing protein [Desulfuromonadales bacterium]
MKRTAVRFSLLAVFFACFYVIWPGQVAAAPVFESLGRLMPPGLRAPGMIDLDDAGNLYATNCRGGEVFKIDPYGNLTAVFSVSASGAGVAVTPDGTTLYVARKGAVVIVDALTGAERGLLAGSAAPGEPEFQGVGEIALDRFGNVFVIDNVTRQIKVYSANGQYITLFGGPGPGAGEFMRMGGLAIDPLGRVIVTDCSSSTTDNGKTHIFTLNPDLSVASVVAYSNISATNFGLPAMVSPRGVTFDNQNRAYFLEFFRSIIKVTDENYRYFGSSYGTIPVGYAVGELNVVKDLVYDRTNNRLFVSCDTLRIEVFGVDGGKNPDPPLSNQAPEAVTA